MEIKFQIETLGYIIAEFFNGNEKIKIYHSSDYGDKFQELLNNFFSIYDRIELKDKNYFPYSTHVLWGDDFVNYQWKISIDSIESPVNIRVNELSSSNAEHNIELINGVISIENLFSFIYLSLNEMLADFGLIGYKQVWEVGNFPVREYLILKAVKNHIELKKEHDSDDNEWKKKVKLSDELGLLNL